MLDKRVAIHLEVGVVAVRVEVVAIGVVGVGGVQSVFSLPCVGHTVAVRVSRGSLAVEHRPSACILLRVDEAGIVSRTGVFCSAFLHILCDVCVVAVAFVRRTAVSHHLVECLVSVVCSDKAVWYGLTDAYGVLGLLCVSVVHLAVVNLVIHSVCPVVGGHLVVF